MEPAPEHRFEPDASFDGGDLDCGSGLLVLLRRHLDPLEKGQLLLVRSREISVDEDLPSWCRMTGNELVSWTRVGEQRSFLICKSRLADRKPPAGAAVPSLTPASFVPEAVTIPTSLPPPSPAARLGALSVMGVGSWPRPRWLLRALEDRLQGKLAEADFEAAADDAVRLAVTAQERAGVSCVTDGEQRRDSYASFVGARLQNCQLIPLTDLLPLVDDPAKFERELRALDVPAASVRHPALLGPLGRARPLAVHELAFLQKISAKPAKVALPGPYLLTRTLWLECLTERHYKTREALAADVVRVLREEIAHLLAQGAALVQLDEPVLTEVVFGAPTTSRSFMCGALSEKLETPVELGFAEELLLAVTRDFPRERLAVHVCRGNWTRDESKALRGDYRPLVGLLGKLPVGVLFLELATERAGELAVLAQLPDDLRVGVGVVNQKLDRVETIDEVLARARHATSVLGRERVLLNPDCGFATFAENPLATAEVAERKLATIAEAARRLR